MTRPDTDVSQWLAVDEGWGRKAADFATLSEPGNCREYVVMHHRLGVDAGDRLLDMACGSGLVHRAGSPARRFLLRYRRLGQAGRGGQGPESGLRHQGRRHERPAVGSGVVRRGDQLPRDLGHHTRCGGRDAPGPSARRTGRDHGVGSHEGVSRGLGAGAVPPGRDGEGRQPGGDGVAGPAGAGEQLLESCGFADVERMDVPFAVGVRGSGAVRARPGLYRSGLRGHPERGRGRVPSRRRRAGRRRSCGMACRCGPRSRSWATWPANPKEHNTHNRQLRGASPAAGGPVMGVPGCAGWGEGGCAGW